MLLSLAAKHVNIVSCSSRTLGMSNIVPLRLFPKPISHPQPSVAHLVLICNRYNATAQDLFELFGKFGPIRYVQIRCDVPLLAKRNADYDSQIRQGIAGDTKGTAFVVYEEVMDAKQACDKLNGFNFQNRYLVGMNYCYYSSILDVQFILTCRSALPSARQDGQVESGPRGAKSQFRSAQTATRYRLAGRADHSGGDCRSAIF
jgi:hypothetical protein